MLPTPRRASLQLLSAMLQYRTAQDDYMREHGVLRGDAGKEERRNIDFLIRDVLRWCRPDFVVYALMHVVLEVAPELRDPARLEAIRDILVSEYRADLEAGS